MQDLKAINKEYSIGASSWSKRAMARELLNVQACCGHGRHQGYLSRNRGRMRICVASTILDYVPFN
jgi:hypothetical protein